MTSNGAGEQVAIASAWPWTWVNIPLRFSKLMSYAIWIHTIKSNTVQ